MSEAAGNLAFVGSLVFLVPGFGGAVTGDIPLVASMLGLVLAALLLVASIGYDAS